MTERVVIEHKIHCSEKTFWELFLDDEYNRTIFKDRLQFDRWEIVSRSDDGETMRRVVEAEPKVGEFPAPVKKVIGERIAYREEGSYHHANQTYQFQVFPGVLADKFRIKGQQTTRQIDATNVMRVFSIEVEVKVFGVGGLIERAIVADLKKSYDRGAAFTNEYIKDNNLS